MTTPYEPTNYPSAARATQLLITSAPTGYQNALAHTLATLPERADSIVYDALARHSLFAFSNFASVDAPVAWAILTYAVLPGAFGDVATVQVFGTLERAHRAWAACRSADAVGSLAGR